MNLRKTIFQLISVALLATILCSCNPLKKSAQLSDRRQLENSALFIDAFHLRLLGRSVEALEIYERIAQSDPRHAASRYEMAKLYALQKNFEKAFESAKSAVKIDPTNKWYKMLLIDLYDKTGDHKSKVPVYQQLIKENPRDMSLYYGLANAHMQQSNVKNAIAVLNDLEASIGISEELSIQKYQFYVMARNYAAAIEEIKKLAQIFPNEVSYAMAIADYYLQTGNYYEALSHYTAVYERDNSNYEALISMAECYMRIGNKAKATQLFMTLFADANVDVDAKMNIVLYYYEVSEKDSVLKTQAFELLEVYERTHPGEAKVYSVYADFLYREKKYSEAASYWKKVIDIDPSKFTVWEHLFACYEMMQEYELLHETALKSIDFFPEQPSAFFYAGYAFYMQKNYEKSLNLLADAAELSVSDKRMKVMILLILADAHAQLQNHEESDSTYENILKTDPRNYRALNNYSYNLALRNLRLEDALLMSEKTIKAHPKNPAYLDTYGFILYQLNRHEEAESYLLKAVEYSIFPDSGTLEHYADALAKLGRIEEAIRYYRLAIDAGGDALEMNSKIQLLKNNE